MSDTDASQAWSEGWYQGARHCASPNFGPRPVNACVDLVVLHSISLPPGQYGGQAVHDLFLNRLNWDAHPYFQSIRGTQVSTHFFIRRDGQIWQFVSTRDRAWHAGQSVYRGRENCNDDSVGVELEGLEGGEFTDLQYEALVVLLKAIARIHPLNHVAGHEHIAPGRKFDPGVGFLWKKLQQDLDWPARFFP